MANDGIRIDIGQLNFDNGKEIAKGDYEYNAMNVGSTYTFWNGNNTYKLYDGINSDEAEYIITEFKNAGYLADGTIDMDEINEFLTTRFNKQFGEGKWEEKGNTTQKAAEQLYNLVGLIVQTYGEAPAQSTGTPINTEGKDATLTQITEGDNAGNYTVQVQAWGDSALEGNNNANDCLYRIMKNYYPGIEAGSDEWKALEAQIMNLNPNIYGTVDDSGNWTPSRNTLIDGSRQNSVIYTGESIILPSNKTETIEDEDPPTTGNPDDEDPKPEEYDMSKVVTNIKNNFSKEQLKALADGNYVSYDDDSDLNVRYKDGILHIYDATSGNELGKITILLEDLGYTPEPENKTGGTGLTQTQYDEYQQYANILMGNDSWNTEYVKNLMTALATGNQPGTYVASNADQKAQYLNEVKSYINNLKKFSGQSDKGYEQAQYNNVMTMANMMGQDPVQMYLNKVNDPNKDIATANREMNNYWTNVNKLGVAYLEAKNEYTAMTNRSATAEYMTGIYNFDIRSSIFFDQNYEYNTAMLNYDGSETNEYGNSYNDIFNNVINTYKNTAQNYKDYYQYDTDAKINELGLDSATADKLKKLVSYYDDFKKEGGKYDKIVNVAFWVSSPNKDSAKNLAKNAETLFNYYFNGKIPATIPDIDEILRIFQNNVPNWT